MDMSNKQRIEGVKLPNIYKEKTDKERKEDGMDLLDNFQKLINKYQSYN